MKFSLKKIPIILFFIVGNIWLYTKIFWPTSFTDVPEALSHLYSKEVCSCVFVSGRDRDGCLKDNRSLMKPTMLKVDAAQKQVFAKVLWADATAEYKGERQGCQIKLR